MKVKKLTKAQEQEANRILAVKKTIYKAQFLIGTCCGGGVVALVMAAYVAGSALGSQLLGMVSALAMAVLAACLIRFLAGSFATNAVFSEVESLTEGEDGK